MNDSHPVPERGFTLVEMIAVLVVMALAMVTIFPGIVSLSRSGSRTTALSSASGEAKLALRIFQHDVRSARGDRANGDRQDPGTTDSVVDALLQANMAQHDIRAAGPRDLTLNVDVLPAVLGIERVRWQLVTDNAACWVGTPNWCIIRTVSTAGGVVMTTEAVTHGRGAYPVSSNCGNGGLPAAVRLFCYRINMAPSSTNAGTNTSAIRWDDPAWSPRCASQPWTDLTTPPAPAWITIDHDGLSNDVRIHALDRITTIGIVLPAGSNASFTSERVLQTGESTIRSRQGSGYQYAIMCGGR